MPQYNYAHYNFKRESGREILMSLASQHYPEQGVLVTICYIAIR